MEYLIALGGNNSTETSELIQILKKGLAELECHSLTIRRLSRFFRTPAFPAGNGPDFVNAAVLMEGQQTPERVLAILHSVEAALGRVRAERWGRRTLDLDLLACGQVVVPDVQTHKMWRELPLQEQQRRAPTELILPHPRLQDRAFVLVPLCDIAPDWCHPLLNLTVREMLENLSEEDRDGVQAL